MSTPKVSDDQSFSLRVRNLPAVLSTEAITTLLIHYGATHVRVLQRRNLTSGSKEPGADLNEKFQKAVAQFPTEEAQENAKRRLNLLKLAGHSLIVKAVGDKAATMPIQMNEEAKTTKRNDTSSVQPLLPKAVPPPLPPLPAPLQSTFCDPAPLAPHLGIYYASSPLLEYKYPKATETLIALPRFYTQVLHLMNKMNLPAPFKENAIPGRFSEKQDVSPENFKWKHLKRRQIDSNLDAQIVEEDEINELEFQNKATEGKLQSVEKKMQPPKDSFCLSKATGSITALEKARCEGFHSQKAKPSKRHKGGVKLSSVFQDEIDSKNQKLHRPTRPGVISDQELRQHRIAPTELLKEPLMRFYDRGLPSRSILITNVADGVDKGDLRTVFGYVLPHDVSLVYALLILLLKMRATFLSTKPLLVTLLPDKNSAIIDFPDQSMASAAIDQLHGLHLEGKTLIVKFYDVNKECLFSTVTRWTVEELASRRLLDGEIALLKAIKNYQRGDPTNMLYVKNLAKTVELVDLYAVFGAVLPISQGLQTMNIRHFSEGRMKCQAFVTYPTIELASSALLHVHGVVLKDKPVIVLEKLLI
ncbi:hypothetical protein CCR75_004469 [Bremia lactucae]|uniref:RRM domain-containing protein n=1 Tax=Bremia lactucae TaxID=4779 RepID=A0A976FK77_BRELC|nr:hypothetical protein CCR75_004469 [Bremia lactucae]